MRAAFRTVARNSMRPWPVCLTSEPCATMRCGTRSAVTMQASTCSQLPAGGSYMCVSTLIGHNVCPSKIQIRRARILLIASREELPYLQSLVRIMKFQMHWWQPLYSACNDSSWLAGLRVKYLCRHYCHSHKLTRKPSLLALQPPKLAAGVHSVASRPGCCANFLPKIYFRPYTFKKYH